MELPTITEQDLRTFHLKHFPATSLPQSFAPAEDRGQEEEEDDLGYYPDGTKRTLTDDQIAMFRHSEIQQLLRKIRSQGIASSREAGSVDNVETNVAEISGVHSGDQRNSHKWPGAATNTDRGNSSEPRRGKKRRRPNQAPRSPINGVRHDPEDYLEEGEEHTYRRKCREADEQKAETVLLDY